jgi:uncharacterized protein YukJ
VRPRSRFAHQTSRYGVLVGQVVDGREDPPGPTPHYEIWLRAGGDYRVAVNVESSDDSEVVAHFEANYTAPPTLDLAALAGAPGFKALTTGEGGEGLDYLRDKLFPLDSMTPIPATGSGLTLASLLDAEVAKAKADPGAVAIVFGNAFEDRGKDAVFGFSPEQGVHDVHMLQGDPPGRYAADDRPHGDGALFFRFSDGTTAALFIRFGTQSTAL